MWGETAFLAGLLLLGLSLAPVALREFRRHFTPACYVDCASLPPGQAFEEVFCQSKPAGVSDIQGSGIPQSGHVWMRLRATDAAVKIVTRGRKPDASKVERCIDPSACLQWPGAARVHWEDAFRVRLPQCYYFGVDSNPTVDYIIMVVDRQRHLVYVYRHYI